MYVRETLLQKERYRAPMEHTMTSGRKLCASLIADGLRLYRPPDMGKKGSTVVAREQAAPAERLGRTPRWSQAPQKRTGLNDGRVRRFDGALLKLHLLQLSAEQLILQLLRNVLVLLFLPRRNEQERETAT